MHTQSEYLTSYALGQLPQELAIIVDFHVRACASCGADLEQARASIDSASANVPRRKRLERRKNVRISTDTAATFIVLKPQRSAPMDARVLDASKEGLQLRVGRELAPGAVLQVHMHNLFILAEVRHCRPVGGVFHIGVVIQDVFEAFKPLHSAKNKIRRKAESLYRQ
jgi:hypothetical protein